MLGVALVTFAVKGSAILKRKARSGIYVWLTIGFKRTWNAIGG